MKKFSPLVISVACAIALGGCAVSNGLVAQKESPEHRMIENASLPPLPDDLRAPIEPIAPEGKFAQSDAQSLVVENSVAEEKLLTTPSQQAYVTAALAPVQIETEQAQLKPYVGRWRLAGSDMRSKANQIGSYLGLSEPCELMLEELRAGYGYKASGSSACPTSLFMLDSWVAFDGRLVLRDHMGDEIVKLRSQDGLWVGVSKQGKTLVLRKS